MAFNADDLTMVTPGEVYDYSTSDTIATVTGDGYFASAAFYGLVRGVRIYVTISGTTYETVVTAIEDDGGATVENVTTIEAGDLATDSVTTAKIAANAVTAAKIATGAVGSTQLGTFAEATGAAIADVGDAINTTGKTKHKLVFDTTNTRLMIASDTAAADPWYVVDGSVTVTPV